MTKTETEMEVITTDDFQVVAWAYESGAMMPLFVVPTDLGDPVAEHNGKPVYRSK